MLLGYSVGGGGGAEGDKYLWMLAEGLQDHHGRNFEELRIGASNKCAKQQHYAVAGSAIQSVYVYKRNISWEQQTPSAHFNFLQTVVGCFES